MGLISTIIKAGVAAAGAYAAVKVSKKYKENNPEGIIDSKEKYEAIKQAASEVYNDVAAVAKEKGPGMKNTVDVYAQKAAEFAKENAPIVQHAAEDLYGKAKEAAPGVCEKAEALYGKAKEAAPSVQAKAEELYGKAKDAAPGVFEKAESFAGKAKEYIENLDQPAADAEVIPVNDPPAVENVDGEIVEFEAPKE